MATARTFIALAFLLFFVSNVSAIKINEIEINPVTDYNEWVELYNDESDLDISGWEIWEGVYGSQGPKLITTISDGTIIQENDFYIIEWSQSKLNNGGDFVILYDSSENKIDETEIFEDDNNDNFTWQLCDIWEFKVSTKGEKNSCEIQTEEPPPEEIPDTNEPEEKKVSNKEEPIIEELSTAQESNKQSTQEKQVIDLNPQVIKTENDNENLGESESKNENYAVYEFIAFCILIVVLFLMRRGKYKTEFV